MGLSDTTCATVIHCDGTESRNVVHDQAWSLLFSEISSKDKLRTECWKMPLSRRTQPVLPLVRQVGKHGLTMSVIHEWRSTVKQRNIIYIPVWGSTQSGGMNILRKQTHTLEACTDLLLPSVYLIGNLFWDLLFFLRLKHLIASLLASEMKTGRWICT